MKNFVKGAKKTADDIKDGVKMKNDIGMNKKKRHAALKEMIENASKKSLIQKKSNAIFKPEKVWGDQLRDKLKKKKEANMKKINKIKIKTKKI